VIVIRGVADLADATKRLDKGTDRLLSLTVGPVVLAALTLAAAVVTLIAK
jgi:hypothetical protein